jgi:hypothetical protein
VLNYKFFCTALDRKDGFRKKHASRLWVTDTVSPDGGKQAA